MSVASNKQLVLDFYETAFNRKDIGAVAAFIGPDYVQHNPAIGDGLPGLLERLGQLADASPELTVRVTRLIAEGDHVTAHVHAVRAPGQRGVAIMDIFRVVGGKLVEHWDVMQDVPEHSKNPNGMF